MAGKFAEFRYGWPVVFASAVGIGLGMSPLPFYTIGVFIAPYAEEFGWTTGQVLRCFPIFTFTALFMSPVIGQLTDRFGSRRVALTSIVAFSLSMMAFAFQTGSLTFYYFLWFLLAVTGAGTLPITWTRAVNSWFFERRGLALGFALIGTGIFGVIAKQYAFWLIGTVGWRNAYLGLGALPLLIAFPIAYRWLREATDPAVADKAATMARETPGPAVRHGGLTLSHAVRDWRFWLLAYAFVPISFAVGGPIPNMETIMGTKGFSPEQAVNLAAVIGYAVVFGRVVGGYLLDHFWAPMVAATILSLPAIAAVMLAQSDYSFWYAVTAIFILGMAAGVEYDLMAYLVSRYFGIAHYGAIYGALYGFFALGAGIGPAVFASFFDRTGSYDGIFMVSAALFLVGALPLLLLGKYRDYTEPLSDAEVEKT